MDTTKVAIVGAGPAGLTAALYLGRAQIPTVLIDKDYGGGQIISSPLLENVPGYYGPGADLAFNMLDEIKKYPSVELRDFTKVMQVIEVDGMYELILNDGSKLAAQYVICATGADPIKLPGINTPNTHYCVTCDGALYQDKVVGVIGGGNSALQYALELANYASEVIVITNEAALRGEENMRKCVLSHDKIRCVFNFTAAYFDGKCLEDVDGETFIEMDGLFMAIGYKPQNGYLDVPKNNGYFVTGHYCKVYGNLYAAGDCRMKNHNQVVIAMRDGCVAALDIIEKEQIA